MKCLYKMAVCCGGVVWWSLKRVETKTHIYFSSVVALVYLTVLTPLLVFPCVLSHLARDKHIINVAYRLGNTLEYFSMAF